LHPLSKPSESEDSRKKKNSEFQKDVNFAGRRKRKENFPRIGLRKKKQKRGNEVPSLVNRSKRHLRSLV